MFLAAKFRNFLFCEMWERKTCKIASQGEPANSRNDIFAYQILQQTEDYLICISISFKTPWSCSWNGPVESLHLHCRLWFLWNAGRSNSNLVYEMFCCTDKEAVCNILASFWPLQGKFYENSGNLINTYFSSQIRSSEKTLIWHTLLAYEGWWLRCWRWKVFKLFFLLAS